MAGCDDFARAQDAARGAWVEQRREECATYEDRGRNECAREEDQGYQACTATRDDGYSQCTATRDEGYNRCCDWIPCSWLCDAYVWVANVVCVAWTWVAHVVCVAWTWVAKVVCVAWNWVANLVCVATTWVVDKVWSAGTAIAAGACRVWDRIFGLADENVRRKLDLSDLPPFPRDFLWGASTAGYQVEGGITNNDWHIFTTSPAIVARVRGNSQRVGLDVQLRPAEQAIQHANLDRLKEDLDRARVLGLNAYRFSIEWSRIEPSRGTDPVPGQGRVHAWDRKALDYYRGAIAAMKARGLEPIVTLNHLTLPAWALTPPAASDVTGLFAVEDQPFLDSLRGWENPETLVRFVEYAQFVAYELQNDVKWWITLNEPVGSMIGVGYLGGVWPPGFVLDGDRARRAYFNLLRAHVAAYDAIRGIYGSRECHIGIAHAMMDMKVAAVNYAEPALTSLAAGAGVGGAVGVVAGAVLGGIVGGPVAAAGAALGLGIVGAVAGAVTGVVAGMVGALIVAGSGQHAAARNQMDYFYNWHFLDSLVLGTVDTNIARRRSDQNRVDARVFYALREEVRSAPWTPRLDFVGVNFYRGVYCYYQAVIAARASFAGGAFDNVIPAHQPHNLLNELGWEISPEGLYFLLEQLRDRYRVPLGAASTVPIPALITENGLPEEQDRLRAPFTVSHLQHLLLAIKDGSAIVGYIHWSLADNFEWQEHYRRQAKFGLFRIDDSADPRHTATSPLDRHISEGALALQYVIAETAPRGPAGGRVEGVGQAAERFGSIASDGKTVHLPSKSAGALFAGTIARTQNPAGGGSPFLLYASPLSQAPGGPADQPAPALGMIFYEDIVGQPGVRSRRWVRLRNISFDRITGILTFQHDADPATGGASASFSGQVDGPVISGGLEAGTWSFSYRARKVDLHGTWQASSEDGTAALLLQLSDIEGVFGGWNGKYAAANGDRDGEWLVVSPSVSTDSQGRVSLTVTLPRSGTLSASLQNGVLSGPFSDTSGTPRNWSAARLPDDVV